MKHFLLILLGSFIVYFFSWFVVYKLGINNLPLQSEDSLPAVFLPLAVIKENTFYLDTYYNMMLERYPHPDDKDRKLDLTPFYLKKVQEIKIYESSDKENRPHYVSAFPVISGLLAIPFYLPFMLFGTVVSWENLLIMSHLSSAGIMALGVGFFYLLIKRFFIRDEKTSITITFIYAFCTINYALISQALWQHGTVQLLSILGLYFLLKSISAENRDYLSSLFFSGFFFGWAVLSRPTALLPAGIFTLLVYLSFKSNFWKVLKSTLFYILGLIPPGMFFLWYNNTFYKTIANQGYADQLSVGWQSNIIEGFLGLWISPSKGILVYSPFLIFAFIGLFIVIRDRKFKDHLPILLSWLVVLIQITVMGKWKHWYGGWSFGYRMASDITPFLMLLLIPYLKSDLYRRTRKFFIVTVAFSFLVELFGIIFFDGIWHSAYDRGYTDTGWLWSIKDSEFVFNIRRILVKLNLLERACPKCLP